MSEQPPLERLADLVYEWAMDEGVDQCVAEDLADKVQDQARDTLRDIREKI